MFETLRTAAFKALVLRPLRLGQSMLGQRMWLPVESASRRVGTLLGRVARPWFVEKDGHASVSALMNFNQAFEEVLGIQGTNEVLSPDHGRRVIHHCPYASYLRFMPTFCMAVGKAAGDTVFDAMIPGATFEIVATKSSGCERCEYHYRLPR